ncbi:hypothetical protein BH23GEM3_BH23GEM3_08900 [soil metagenome]|nr:hypothetical protein [Gemmatimonadota bacterium]
MSDAAERTAPGELPASWSRLERAAAESVLALETWRSRALEAEEEIPRLRAALEEAVAHNGSDVPDDTRAQIRRLRAENTALRSRMTQARRRVSALLAWAGTVGGNR